MGQSMMLNFTAGFGRLVTRLAWPFETSASPGQIQRVIVAARVCTGLVLTHQALDSLGFLPLLGPAAATAGRVMLGNLVAAGLLTAGLFTPFALAWILLSYTFGYAVHSLGNQVTLILTWALLVVNAGRYGSLDGLIARTWPAAGRVLFGFGIDTVGANKRAVAVVRFGALTLYWGVCMVAMFIHIKDRHWWNAQVLPMSLTGPFYSDFFHTFQSWAEYAPQLFGLGCAAGLAVQVVWEVALLPLMYCYPGRWFVRVQGLLFFLSSVILLNLQYLPVIELCFWLLLFGDRLVPEWNPGGAEADAPVTVWSPAATGFATASAAAVALFLAIFLAKPTYFNRPPSLRDNKLAAGLRLFGQWPVNVFNLHDLLYVNLSYLVIHETDGEGRHLRLVPYFDRNGARLWYMRNDLLYFGRALGWHRNPAEYQFIDGDPARPAPISTDLARTVASLDTRLRGYQGERHYKVEVYQRDLHDDVWPVRWSRPRHVASWPLTVRAEDLPSPPGWGWPVYDLPPGHWNQGHRARVTEERLSVTRR